MKTKVQKGTIAITICIMLLTALCSYFGLFARADYVLGDLLSQRSRGVNPNIIIIGIDDKSLAAYGPLTSWRRDIPAQLVEQLNTDENTRPAVLAFDILYSEETDAQTDAEFAAVCEKYDNIVLATAYHFKPKPEQDENGVITVNPYAIEYVLEPYEALRGKTEVGFVNTIPDADGCVRRIFSYFDTQTGRDYSLAFKVYEMLQEHRGEEVVVPKVAGRENFFYFSYFGNPGAYTYYSLTDVLDGKINPVLFQDAVVLVGAYAAAMQDTYAPAIRHGGQMYGVEIHANIIDALLAGKTQIPVNDLLYALFAGVTAGLFVLLLRRSRVVFSTIYLVGGILVDTAVFLLLYLLGYRAPVAVLLIAFLLIYAGHLISSYYAEARRRRQVTGAFKQYVAPQIVEKIAKDKNFKLVLGGENRHIAVLFVDIRGFTTMSESLPPEQVVEILNEYLSLTTKSILDNGGTLDKFVGDATMAVFNAPFDLDDYIYRAVHAAWDMKQGADEITERLHQRFGKKVAFGIGVNCGPAVVGNIGCNFRMDYTAIGDTVNTSARLESNAKAGEILISSEVYESIRDRVEVTPVGEIPLKGKSKGVFVYRVENVR